MDIKDMTLKFYQEKESTIQYDVLELLQTDLSDDIKKHLRKLNSSNIEKLLSFFRSWGSTDHSLSHRTDQRLIIFREFFKISLTP